MNRWLSAVLLLTTGLAYAHHSPAVFDRTKQVTMTGTVKEFRWSNPHSSIELLVPNDKGGTDQWAVEMGSPNHLVKGGWKSTTIKAGERVTVVIHPLRTDEKAGQFVSVTLPNGQTLTERGPVSR